MVGQHGYCLGLPVLLVWPGRGRLVIAGKSPPQGRRVRSSLPTHIADGRQGHSLPCGDLMLETKLFSRTSGLANNEAHSAALESVFCGDAFCMNESNDLREFIAMIIT